MAEIARVVERLLIQYGKTRRLFEIETSVYVDGVDRQRSYPSVDAFLADSGQDADDVYAVTIWGVIRRGLAPRDDPAIQVKLTAEHNHDGVHIAVDAPADYREFFDSAIAQVQAVVGRRELNRPKLGWAGRLTSIVLSVAALLALAFAGDRISLLIVAVVLLFLAAVAAFLPRTVVYRLFPPFELLPSGGVTKARRVWRRSIALAKDLARPAYGALLAAIFAAVIARLFG